MNTFKTASFLCLGLLLLNCGTDNAQKTITEKAPIYFHEVDADSSGITFENTLHFEDDLNIIEYLYFYNGGGVAIGDLNNDGLDDIYLTGNQTADKLYINQGNLKFSDVSAEAGISTTPNWSSGVTMEDVNNDGYLDIYVSKVGNYKNLKATNELYINNGDGTFTENAEAYGLHFSGFSTQAAFLDYDGDGDMDMYLLNHAVHTVNSYGEASKRNETSPLSGDVFYENLHAQGENKFINVTKKAGIYSSQLGYGLAITTADVNNDGYLDIYVGNDFHENDYLYINNGDKTFTEAIQTYTAHNSRFTMGVAIADMNNDLNDDIFTLDMMPDRAEVFLKSAGEDSDKVKAIKARFGYGTQYARNHFQLNQNNTHFVDVALLTETHATDWSWSVLLEDFDNDTNTDIFISNGIYKRPNDLDYVNFLSTVDFGNYKENEQNELERKLIEKMPTLNIPNVVFKNNGNLNFSKYTSEAGLTPSYSNGAAYSDLDNDGDIDIVVNNINQKAGLLENQSTQNNAYISVAFGDSEKHINANGAKVTVFTKNQRFTKTASTTKGFQSSSSRKVHFGLGEAAKIDSIGITYSNGGKQQLKDVAINQVFTVVPDSNYSISTPTIKETPSTYTASDFPFINIENTYLDYENEALIPEKLSAEGPSLVTADFNNDGLSDLFIGAAKNQRSQLYFQQADGSYQKLKSRVFDKDEKYEDVAAAAIDIDKDGNLDLYVLSGGSDALERDPILEDRIYINNGKNDFIRLPVSLPMTNGGSISVGDMDNNGFNDLFIGSKSIPGGYGLSPISFILKNTEKGNFELVSQMRLGMVSDSEWADLNNDGFDDLIVVGDWMPITVLINKGDGTFENQTATYGLAETTGLWNTVTVVDVNQDGTLDIIGGNAGHNLKWKASVSSPVTLYLDDFDKNEQLDPIIFNDFFGTPVPFAAKDPLMGQLPSLKKKFLSYNTFSSVKDIEALTGKKEADVLEIKTIKTLTSTLFLNQGSSFEAIPLPLESQFSPIQDMVQINAAKDTMQFAFIGNEKGFVNELGEASANAGGIIQWNTKTNRFDYEASLPLPPFSAPKHITNLSKGRVLIGMNKGQSVVLSPKK